MKNFNNNEANTLKEIILYRRDVRGNRFLNTPISDAVLDDILFAGMNAPSVGFSQPWEFVIVKDDTTKNKIKATTKEDHYITINKKDISHLKISLEYNGPVAAPVENGKQIAKIIISKKDEILKSVPLYAAEDLKKVNFFKSLLTSINYLIWGDA